MPEDVISNMIEALNLEIKAIKKRGGKSAVEVRGGEFKGYSAGNFLYAFPVTEDIYLRDDSPIRIVINKEEVDGVVVSLSEGVLVIALERDLGPRIAFAQLISDDSFLIERLKEKFEEIQGGTVSFFHKKAFQTIGEEAGHSSDAEIDKNLLIGTEDPLNNQQKKAIVRAIGSEITYIWGPPGTGKTTVLAHIAEGYYRSGLSVLLVSNTNIAVDTALEKIGDRLKTDTGFQSGTVLRHGPILKPELKEKYGTQLDIEAVVERLGQNLQKQKLELETSRTKIKKEAETLHQAIAELERFEELKRLFAHHTENLQNLKEKEKSNQSSISSLSNKLKSLKYDWERVQSMGSLKRFFTGLDQEKIEKQIGIIEAEHASMKKALSEISSEIQKVKVQLHSEKNQIKEQEEFLIHYPTKADCNKNLADYENQFAKFNQEIQAIKNQLDALRAKVIANCKILATTVYRTYLKGQVDRSFDAVIVDEASMLALPMVFYAAGLASKHVVVAGDFRQIPAIVMSDDPMAVEWLKKDVFRKAGIEQSIRDSKVPNTLVALKTQYRMNEKICSIINRLFYSDHKLETPASIRLNIDEKFPLDNKELLYIDTAKYHPWTSIRLGTFSRYNILHALLLRNLTFHLYKEKYLPIDKPNTALGIISPYSAQTNLIQKLIDEKIFGKGKKIAATIHRFQGNEKNTMLIDITDSIGFRPSKFIKATSINDDGARLLNVALSRARHHIILIANFEYLNKKLLTDSFVNKILDIFVNEGSPLKVKELLSIGPDDWLDGLNSLENSKTFEFDPSTSGIFNEGTFYSAFKNDIKKSTNSVVIFSPFLTQSGANRWIDILRFKTDQGVRIRLVTRPVGDQGGVLEQGLKELISDIINVGVIVDLRKSLHEKFAIIDKEILWHGSLNIFSHKDTSESMLRIPSASACQQIASFVTSPKQRSKENGDIEYDLSEKENPVCHECGKPMVWKNGRYGIYFQCENCKKTIDPRRTSLQTRVTGKRPRRQAKLKRNGKTLSTLTNHKCPRCGHTMSIRKGKYGEFLGCTNYPSCKYKENIRSLNQFRLPLESE